MAKNSCITRIVNSINKSRITSVDKQELINKIKIAIADTKKTNLDNEILGEFYVYISEFDTDTDYFGNAKTVNEAIELAKKLLQTWL